MKLLQILFMKEEKEKDFPYVNVRSEPPQYCKVVSLQLKEKEKNNKVWVCTY